MNMIYCGTEVVSITLDSTDTLEEMAAVSGYTTWKLKRMIERIINDSIEEERRGEE